MFAERTKWNLAPNPLSEALAALRSTTKPLFDLTMSNPTECGFRYANDAILAALSNVAALRYEPNPRGMASARSAVAGYYAERGGQVPVDDILLTTGTSEAYSFVFRLLCNPGDNLLIPAPSYPLLDFLADIHDVRLVHYPLLYDYGWQIDFHELEKRIDARTRAIVVVHPNNPTGHFTGVVGAKRLSQICAAHEIALIADEVFLDFVLGEKAPLSFATNSDALAFTMSGISKISGLPQMKAAWLAVSGPSELKAHALARLEVIADTYLSMNAPIQLALPAFLEKRHPFQEQLMTRVRKNLSEMDRQLASQDACSRLVIEGGWYLVIRLPSSCNDGEFAVNLLRSQGVYVHPGHFYDFSDSHHVVVSLITPEEHFSEGVRRLLSQANG